MSFVYIAAHPNQRVLAYSIAQSLEASGVTTWQKDNFFDWDYRLNAAILQNIILASSLLIFVDDPNELDPLDYISDILEAKKNDKPFFVIKSEREFELLLPQLRQFMPRHRGLLPLPLMSFEKADQPQSRIRLRPDWLEISLFLLLVGLIIFIMMRL